MSSNRAAVDDLDGWVHWEAATSARAKLPDTASREKGRLLDREPATDALEDLREAVERSRDALDEVDAAVHATRCTHPAGDGRENRVARAEAVPSLLAVLDGRALLALHDGDEEAAVRDVETALAAPRALLGCGAGVHFAATFGLATMDVIETAAVIGTSLDGDLRTRVVVALEHVLFTSDDVVMALEDDAADIDKAALADLPFSDMAYFVGALTQAESRIDELIPVLAAHPRVFDADATVAQIRTGIEDLSRLFVESGPDLADAAMEPFDALMAELGPSAVIFNDPPSLRSGVSDEVIAAFHAVTNPFGRLLAAFIVGQEAAATVRMTRLVDEIAKYQSSALRALRR